MPYKVGDTVWYAKCGSFNVSEICPVCFGELKVTLILGNGDHVELPCDYCGKGYEAPTGCVTEHRFIAEPVLQTITRVEIISNMEGENREYYSSYSILPEEDIFDNEKDAALRAAERAEKYNNDVKSRNFHVKGYSNKNYSWCAGYHLRNAKKCEEEAARHRRDAVICKEKAKV